MTERIKQNANNGNRILSREIEYKKIKTIKGIQTIFLIFKVNSINSSF